jgi:hypothetical protein
LAVNKMQGLKLTYCPKQEVSEQNTGHFLPTLGENDGKPEKFLDYFTGGSLMPGRNVNAGDYRFMHQGQESDAEIYGVGNSYAYEYRMSDPRLIRFWSIDPLAKKYPNQSPYVFSENRLIDGIEWEGLEYVSAADWASNNLIGSDWSNRNFMYEWQTLRQKKWAVNKVKDATQCYESVLASYAQANNKVAEYIDNQGGMPRSRKGAVNSFKEGGPNHSFIEPEDASQVERGDAMFKGSFEPMDGHSAIVASSPEFSENGEKMTLEVLSTNTGESENEFGTKAYTFEKNEDGEWVTTGPDPQKLRGFGRVDEEAIKDSSSSEGASNNNTGTDDEQTE